MTQNFKQISNKIAEKLNNKYYRAVILTMLGLTAAAPWVIKEDHKPLKNIQKSVVISEASGMIVANLQNTVPINGHGEVLTILANKQIPTSMAIQLIAGELKNQEIAEKSGKISKKTSQSVEQTKVTVSPNKKLHSAAVTFNQTDIDHNFIHKVEGLVLKGYVPLPKQTKSGVTIAAGFDLGQMTLQEFYALPMSEEMRTKLRPYIGLKKFEAVRFLKSNPLHVNKEEAKQLNIIAANKILIPLSISYKKATGKSFTSLPPAAQTVLFSFAYHYGPGFMKKPSLKTLWHCFVTENWSKAIHTLHSFKMYQGRRKQEAKLLAGL